MIGDLISEVLENRQRGGLCPVGRYLASLDDDDAAKVRAALKHQTDETYTLQHRELAAKLAEYGARPTDHAIGRHRRGVCSCGSVA